MGEYPQTDYIFFMSEKEWANMNLNEVGQQKLTDRIPSYHAILITQGIVLITMNKCASLTNTPNLQPVCH